MTGNGKVVVGFCHGDSIRPEWRQHYTAVLVRDAYQQRRVIGELDHWASGAHVATARSKIVAEFIANPDMPEWLWMVDTDATFAPDVLDRLLASADPVDRPIVGALAFVVAPTKTGDGEDYSNAVGASPLQLSPTLFRVDDRGQTWKMWHYADDDIVDVDGTGCHCLLIHRSVLEDAGWDRSHPQPWFRSGTVLNGGEVSEDMFFCLAARELGYRVVVDTAIKTGHVKTFIADEDAYLAQRPGSALRRRRTVLVPSRTFSRAARMIEQLDGEDIDELIIAWNGDGAPPACKARVVETHGQGIHQMWNIAVDDDGAGDVLFLNDDVELSAGCVDLLFRAVSPGVAAVCGNYDDRPGTGVVAVSDICAGRYDGTGGLAGFAFVLSRRWLRGTGYRFPEECKWWFGDNDLVLSAQLTRWVTGIVLDAKCRHDHSPGTWDTPEMVEQTTKDRAAFHAKWGFVEVPRVEPDWSVLDA